MAAEDNKAAVLRFYEEVINGMDLNVIDDLLTPDGGRPYLRQPERRGGQAVLRPALPGLPRPARRVCRHPGHRPADPDQRVDFFRMQDGKQAEHWGGPKMASLLQQLGVLPAPGASA
jgi:hypothetical protein